MSDRIASTHQCFQSIHLEVNSLSLNAAGRADSAAAFIAGLDSSADRSLAEA
ncbi:MAG: hypothetical protein KME45_21185 [Stenomitos rutilans HA7619-LM2]|nr:hypothetical protein [Stenomitos rutilans HA7619-LM2]